MFVQTSPEEFRLTHLSHFTIVLMALFWPIVSFYFLDSQMDLTKDVTSPLQEIYLPTLALQLVVLLLVLVSVRSEGVGLDDIGFRGLNRWTILQAVFFFIFANITLRILQVAIALESPESFAEIAGLLPKSTLDKSVWVLLCAVVAVGEEATFRGYLITRITRVAKGKTWVGVLIASLAFASGHLYQGFGGFIVIFVYGVMFSALYLYTGSIYPGIIAHFIQDVAVLFLPQS